MARSNCTWVWLDTSKVPSYFITVDEATGQRKLDFTTLDDFATAVTKGSVTLGDAAIAMKAVGDEYVRAGEDREDAEGVIEQGNAYVGEYGGNFYIFFDTVSGVFVTKQLCGATAYLPYILLGAGLLGTIGFAYGYSRKARGGRGGKKGIPAYALMGATVGLLGGAAGGYALGRVMTDQNTKAWQGMKQTSLTPSNGTTKTGLISVKQMGLLNVQQQMGLLDVRMGATRRRPAGIVRRCPPGQVWSTWAGRCVRPL